MYRKVLVGLIAIVCLGLSLSMFSDLHSSATPEFKSLNSTTFAKPDEGPDPNEIFKLANEARQAEGLSALKFNSQLTTIAEARAIDMAKNNYYGHMNKAGRFYYDMFAPSNISVDYSCENLDLEYTNDANIYVNDWLNSPFGHRQCLMNKSIRQAGYAVTKVSDTEYGGATRDAYIVIAIYSTPVTNK